MFFTFSVNVGLDYLISKNSKIKNISTIFLWIWCVVFDPVVVWFALSKIRVSSEELWKDINTNNIHEEVWLSSREEQNFVVKDDITQDG